MDKIATIISFCTYDLRFLDRCIRAVAPFSSQIIVPVCDHFYDGRGEDLSLLKRIYAEYAHIDFIEFAYRTDRVYGTPAPLVPYSPGWSQHWHSTARLVGAYFLDPSVYWVLFVDVDEIFSADVRSIPLDGYDAIRFGAYWYFQSAKWVATCYPEHPLLIRRELLTPQLILNPDERMGMFDQVEGVKMRGVLIDGKPIVHHYSWVRSKGELIQKVRAWGHHWERDWEGMLDRKDEYVRGYTCREGELFWDPLAEEPSILSETEKPPKAKVTAEEIDRLELRRIVEKRGSFF